MAKTAPKKTTEELYAWDKGFDAEEAYQAVKASATVSHFNSDWETFEKYGYFPFDIIDTESVSKTLECA